MNTVCVIIHIIQYLMPCDITKNAWYLTLSDKHFGILQFARTVPPFCFSWKNKKSIKKKLVRNTAIGKCKSEIVKAEKKPLMHCITGSLYNIY